MSYLEIFFTSINILIAGFVAYVLVQQNKINHLQIKLNLFKKRYRIYNELRKYFLIITRETNVKDEEIKKFWLKAHDACFLFDDHFEEYLDEIKDKTIDLNRTYKNQDNPRLPEDKRNQAAYENGELTKWFGTQLDKIGITFKKYLKFKN